MSAAQPVTGTAPKRVQRQRAAGWRKPDGAVYVGRGTKWGNPYKAGDKYMIDLGEGSHPVRYATSVRTISEAVELYRREWIPLADIDDLRAELAGKDLMCWCPLDQPCHADTLLEIANTPVDISTGGAGR